MNQEEVESQLSAMFDGELSAAECELLSRRIDRDERLRARWSRYALIGAAMRSEPVAAARSGFAARVSAALHASDRASGAAVRRKALRNGALAASLVLAVAGVSITVLRLVPWSPSSAGSALAQASPAGAAAQHPVLAAVPPTGMRSTTGERVRGEPWSYVTPRSSSHAAETSLRTELADYIVAHSVYSAPLMRRNLLSALMSGEDSNAPGESDGPTAAPTPRP